MDNRIDGILLFHSPCVGGFVCMHGLHHRELGEAEKNDSLVGLARQTSDGLHKEMHHKSSISIISHAHTMNFQPWF